jgi:enoyl-CoA hydratase/carnithine racemase
MSVQVIEKRISLDDRIAWLTLNRPEKKNALSGEMMDMLIADINEISDIPEIRVLVLSARGDSFCSGLDLYDLRADHGKYNRFGRAKSTPEIVRLLRQAPQITVAAVQGYALGGGLVLVNACDMAIVADSARLGMPEILRGSYGMVATPTLFQSGIPKKIAFGIQLTGRNMTGEEAARWGLVNECVPEAELASRVDDLARELAKRHPIALAHAKIAAYAALDLPFHYAMQADEQINHRQRYYVDPTRDLDSYLESQKGGGNTAFVRSDAK